MRFFEVILSGAALISAVLAVEFTSFPQGSVAAGKPITLTYTPKDAVTTILLKKGPSTDLKTLDTLTTTSTGGSFTWTPPKTLEAGDDYAFEIQQAGAVPNYSGQFALTGGSAPVASSSSASSSAGYSTAKSSSAPASSSASSASSAYSTAVSTTISTSVVIHTSVGTASASAGTIVPSGYNSTISLGSPSATAGPTSTDNAPPVENTGAASTFGINAAALFGAIGAFAYLA
ncbi:hypothetical protein BU23DRAFT_243536 [Bimuria novae-zelandiae CBS 107.79]|uniref:Yeast cell wall synthesis Kre9/Knh1-like N-terminal domain-containing protein n=1 Tax=Bimuria novae-zelandiae CBS 107.79 TaxID=1447943 RepID=A0A6A5UXK6_9PLEO|nr:hypothetical protein BU23DRAFT_243536 [Bimuria novae-zelandiae CBS 107.79]